MLVNWQDPDKVYLDCGKTDLRKGIDGLAKGFILPYKRFENGHLQHQKVVNLEILTYPLLSLFSV